MKKKVKAILLALAAIGLAACLLVLGLNAWIQASTSGRILDTLQAAELTDVDCILVLGCGVWDDGQPSHMLEDRLHRAVQLYVVGTSPKLLMSGDHGQEDYDEVNVMKQFAIDQGIPSEDIFMDHAGFSTYESLYRARYVFGAEKIVIVSQSYHLYRALNIADALDIEAYGVGADYRSYTGQYMREIREVLARCKDFVSGIFQPDPTYLGDPIDLSGSGDVTNDQ